ncbi:MAG TPA: GntR family transcriptional regulator [Acidimicrobiales bacterium]|nr:GntR family transcriptional regulator [Acidimicrobiales bacterium]
MPAAQPSAQRVYAVTKEQILSGELAGGSLLSEGEVARRLKVSRTPAREAFVRLQAEGLLALLPRRGAVVTPLTPADMVDLLEVRQALEVAAVRRLARREDRSQLLVAARAELDDQAAHAVTLDLPAFAESDQRFHRAIVDAAGNALSSRFYATLGDRQRQMTVGAVGADPRRLFELLGDHRGLLGAAEEGDTDGFAGALRRHFESTHLVLLGG